MWVTPSLRGRTISQTGGTYMLRSSSLLGVLLACVLAARAGATPVTYEFSSTVQGGGIGYYPTYTPGFQPPPNFPSFENGDPGNYYGTLGEPISASVTIETATPDSEPDPTVGTYSGVILA